MFMSQIKILLPFLLLLISIVTCQAQERGVLLVRLNSVDKKVEALKKAGFKSRAELEIKDNDSLTSEFLNYFSLHYRSSDYYFYDSKDAKYIKNGLFESKLLDREGNPIEVNLEGKEIYVAEFGKGKPHDSTENYNGEGFTVRKVVDGEFKRLQHRKSYSGAGLAWFFPNQTVRRSVIKLNRRIYKMMLFRDISVE